MKKIICISLLFVTILGGCSNDPKTNEEIAKFFEDNGYSVAVFHDENGNGYLEEDTCVDVEGEEDVCTITPAKSVLSVSYLMFNEESDSRLRVFVDGEKILMFINEDGYYIIEEGRSYSIVTVGNRENYCYYDVDGNVHEDLGIGTCSGGPENKAKKIITDYDEYMKSFKIGQEEITSYFKWLFDQEFDDGKILYADEILSSKGVEIRFEYDMFGSYMTLDGQCKDYYGDTVACEIISDEYELISFGMMINASEYYSAFLEQDGGIFKANAIYYSNYSDEMSYLFYISDVQDASGYVSSFDYTRNFVCYTTNGEVSATVVETCSYKHQLIAQDFADKTDTMLESMQLNRQSMTNYFKWLCEEYAADLYSKLS